MEYLYRSIFPRSFIAALFLIAAVNTSAQLKIEDDLIRDSINQLKDSARHFYSRGDYAKSRLFIEKSHILVLKLGDADSEELMNSHLNMSLAFISSWEFDSAIVYINMAERIIKETSSDDPLLGLIYRQLGRVYYKSGDLYRAKDIYYRSLSYFLGDKSDGFLLDISNVYRDIGLVENGLGNYSQALSYFRKNERILRMIPNEEVREIINYNDLAKVYANMGDIQKSIEIQENAISLCKKDSVRFVSNLALLYNNIGMDYLTLRDYSSAESCFDRSMLAYQAGGVNPQKMFYLFDSYALLYTVRNEYEIALNYYQKVLIAISDNYLAQDKYDNPEPDQIGWKVFGIATLRAKAEVLTKMSLVDKNQDYLDLAITTSQLAIRVMDDMRNTYLSHESKLQLAEEGSDIFKNALYQCNLAFETSGESRYAQLAFEISEKSKSTVLLAHLRELEARDFGGIPQNLIEEEKVLAKRIAYYKENIYEESLLEEPDSTKIKNWNKYLFEHNRDYAELLGMLEENYPEYYNLKYDAGVVSIEEFQSDLDRGSTLIEYAIVDSFLYSFVVSKSDYVMHTIKLDTIFNKAMDAYLDVFQNFNFSKQSYSSFTEFTWNSNIIYDYLIKPLEDHIVGNKLIIIPDGKLSFLPFETLISEMPNEIPSNYYRTLNYLIKKYSVSYAYSSTLMHQVMKEDKKGGRKRLLAFAPDYGDGLNGLSLKGPITRQRYRASLFPIPGVKEEIENLQKLLPSDVFMGMDASETNFLAHSSEYDLLHLAMHTVIDNENPMFSKLIFSPDADSLNDGLLNTYEIFGLSLKARMVVLSACSTGEGDFSKGEGVMSLARGFVYAGTPSLVMTLWEVEDKSGVILMRNFYKNLLKGMTKTEALRLAKLDFMLSVKPENAHPFFWSSYVVLGNTHPIFHRVDRKVIFILLLLGAAIAVYLIRKRKLKSRA